MLPHNFFLPLRSFWDKNRAVVATWPAEYCRFWLYLIHEWTFAKPASVTLNFHKGRQLAEQKVE